MSILRHQRIVLGVTGSIAAFKAVDVASALVQEGALVDIVLTASAREFIAPLTFQSITRRTVYGNLYDFTPEMSSAHVALGEQADLVAIVPATATTISCVANGSADNLLGCIVLATLAPVLLAPAMNVNMYRHPATQANLDLLRRRGVHIVDPVIGRLASGLVAVGRLAPLADLVGAIRQALGRTGPLAGRHVVVTAGGTQEPIDPVRFVGNRSSGKMGYAIAEASRDRGARVTLIAGPSALPDPYGVEVLHVTTAREMRGAVLAACEHADALVMAAAVADFRPSEPAAQKLKKEGRALMLRLEPNPDFSSEIAALAGDRLVKVYFAAETENVVANAQLKLRRLQADLLVANDVTQPGSGFGVDTNRVTLLRKSAPPEELPLLPKTDVAERVVDEVQALLAAPSTAA